MEFIYDMDWNHASPLDKEDLYKVLEKLAAQTDEQVKLCTGAERFSWLNYGRTIRSAIRVLQNKT